MIILTIQAIINYQLFRARYRALWTRINKAIDMHGATPHVLRHSYLTYAVGETTDYKTVQGISGHSDVNVLLNIYSHPQQQKVTELANNIFHVLSKNAAFLDMPSALIYQRVEGILYTSFCRIFRSSPGKRKPGSLDL